MDNAASGSSLKFGTSGLRGLSVELAGRACAVYATAFARHLLENGRARPKDPVLVGQDFRPSSPAIAASCIGALRRAGLEPLDCGALPTPALALYGLEMRAAALMITGSHIPADRNGIKFYRPDGEIDKSDEASIAAFAATINAGAPETAPAQAESHARPALDLFMARNEALLPASCLRGMTVGIYEHSTVARDLFGRILAFYGARTVPLGRSDVFIPVDTEAVSPQSIALLKAWAREHRLDAIVSADGDGDRPLLTDETGEPLRGDLLGLVAAGFLGAKVVATPVTSNSGIEAAGDYTVKRCRVGSPYVIAAMNEALAQGKDGVMGFEANGGTLTASDFIVGGRLLRALPTRDSFLPVLAMLNAGARAARPLREVAAAYRLPFAASDRLENFAVEKSAALMAHLRAAPDNLAAFLKPLGTPDFVSDLDGLRVTLSDGRIIHLRPSGNAPEMRCYVEAGTENDARTLLDQGLDLIRNRP